MSYPFIRDRERGAGLPFFLEYSTVEVLALQEERDSLVVRIKHLGGRQIRGNVTVDTDYELGRGKRLGSVEPVNFSVDHQNEEDIRIKMNSKLVEEALYKVTITSDDLRFKKIIHHGFLENP